MSSSLGDDEVGNTEIHLGGFWQTVRGTGMGESVAGTRNGPVFKVTELRRKQLVTPPQQGFRVR